MAVHSSEPLKAIIERSDQGTLIIFGWVAEKTPNGVSQLQEIDVKLSTQEKHLLPDSPSFEMSGEQTFDNMDINTVEQKAQPEVVTVGR